MHLSGSFSFRQIQSIEDKGHRLGLYGHIKTVEQRTIIQQYGDQCRTLAVDGWAVTFGTARRGLVYGALLLPVVLCSYTVHFIYFYSH